MSTELRPYIGSRTGEHYGEEVGVRHSIMTYGSDRSGTIRYEFNSLGFRGEEPNPAAAKVVYVAGCSHTLGTGNAEELTWPSPFTERYAESHGLHRDEVSLLNFGEGGTCNRFIARTLVDQCRAQAPDLAIAHFSEVGRTEYIATRDMWSDPSPNEVSRSVVGVGPWQNAGWLKRRVWLFRDFPSVERPAARTILDWARAYYSGTYRHRRAAYETLQDMLLFQLYCQANDIDFLMCCVDYDKLVAELDNPAIMVLWELVDHSRLVDFAVSDDETRVDVAADKSHPGPESHKLFAEKLFNHYSDVQSSSNSSR